MAAALLTLTLLSIGGLAASFVLAIRSDTGASSHVGIAVFSTMLNLLAHSFMMFYLIGKGKAVREAAEEGGLQGDYAGRIAALRAPVFSRATAAMVVLMATAIIGASVDVGVMSRIPHAILAGVALAAQAHTLLAEVRALTGTARIVDDVNARLAGS